MIMQTHLEKLHHIIKDFYEIEGAIPADFLLNQGKGANSLGKARLNAMLRRQGIYIARLHEIKTWEALANQLSEKKVAFSENKAVNFSFPQRNSVGIDIEQVSRFPMVTDYWSDQFYRDNFSDGEIAYCIQQDRQPEHFAGRWCIKEALIKCFPDLLNISFSDIEILINQDNQLVAFKKVNGKKFPLPAALSISHNQEYAIGVAMVQNQITAVEKSTLQQKLKIPSNSFKKWERLTLLSLMLSFVSCASAFYFLLHTHS